MVEVNEAADDGQGQQLEGISRADAYRHIGDMPDDG
jgi:hypothetical protein